MTYKINGYTINNVPKYAMDDVEIRGYVMVVRYTDNELWFYGTYKEGRAIDIAQLINGWVMKPYEK